MATTATLGTPTPLEVVQTTLRRVAERIVREPELHARWLNTLSLMENVGARKIMAFEHRTQVDEMVLKHAAEEARHAYFLKRLVHKVKLDGLRDYSPEFLLAPIASHHYLHALDVVAARQVKASLGLSGHALRLAAYVLVTYAIEVRADMLYGIYQEVLSEVGSPVSVRAIIAEEEGHLQEMDRMLREGFADPAVHTKPLLEEEERLFSNWIAEVAQHVGA